MKNKKQPYLVLVFVGLIFLISCHEPEKTSTSASTPKIIRQKINIAAQSQPITTKKAEPISVTVNSVDQKLVSQKITPKNVQDDAAKKPKNKSKQTLQVAKLVPSSKTDKSDKSIPPSETDMEILLKKLAPKPFKYRPQGKVDPFLPLIAKKKKTIPSKSDTVQKAIRKKRTRILTLLEKFDLSQLKLTAVLRTSKNAVAIVEETSGRGFVVKTGTRIGLNSGRVVDILMDRIIIQEIEELIAGKKLYVTREMKLNKPDSEF